MCPVMEYDPTYEPTANGPHLLRSINKKQSLDSKKHLYIRSSSVTAT